MKCVWNLAANCEIEIMILLLGLLMFLGIHSVSIVDEPWRDRVVCLLGEWQWKGIYSIVAMCGFILIAWGYGEARYDAVILYTPPVWLRHLALLLLLPVFPLLAAAYFPGRIKTIVKHPMLLSTMLWAASHLLANGSLNGLVLFGSFLIWAIVDRISLQSRPSRPIPGAPPAKVNDIIALVVGLGIYFAFLYHLHALLIGVSLL